jgi:hypothetical protein
MEEAALIGLQRDEEEAETTQEDMCGKTKDKTKKKNVRTELKAILSSVGSIKQVQ